MEWGDEEKQWLLESLGALIGSGREEVEASGIQSAHTGLIVPIIKRLKSPALVRKQ